MSLLLKAWAALRTSASYSACVHQPSLTGTSIILGDVAGSVGVSSIDIGGVDKGTDALDTGGAGAASCASNASAISVIQPDIDLEGLGVGDPLEIARD